MRIENPLENNQNKAKQNSTEQENSAENNSDRKKLYFEKYLELSEKEILEDKSILAHIQLANLEEHLQKEKSAGIDFSSIKDFEVRMEKIRKEAGKIAVLSCLEKAKLALEKKDSDSHGVAAWYFATEERLEECKDLISSSDLKLIEEEIKNFRTSFLVGVIAHPEDDYNTQKEKAVEDQEKNIILIYEENLKRIEQDIALGNLNYAKSDFNSLNEIMLEDVVNNKFFGTDLQKRIDDIHKKIEV